MLTFHSCNSKNLWSAVHLLVNTEVNNNVYESLYVLMIFMYRWMINHCRNTDSTERTLPRSDKTRTLKKSFTRRAQHHLTSARPQDTPKSVKHHQLGPERDISSVTPEVYTNESTSYSCRTHLLVLQHIMGYNPTFYSQNQSIYQPATMSGKPQVRNKKGSREKKLQEGEGGEAHYERQGLSLNSQHC